MSCSSPFKVSSGVTFAEEDDSINYQGSVTVSGYSIPGTKICDWVWVPTTWSCKCFGGCVCGGWNPKMCWPTGGTFETWSCWTTPSIEVFPNLTFDYNLTIPMTFEIQTGESITVSGSPTGYITNKIVITDFDCAFTVNGTGFNLSVPCSITISESNGSFSTTYELATLNENVTADGFTYSMGFTFNLLGCLDPTPPEAWLNLQVSTSMSVAYSDDTSTSIYSCNFSAVCPIVDVTPAE